MAFFRISKKKMMDGINQNIMETKMTIDEYFHDEPDHPDKQKILDEMKTRLHRLYALRVDINELIVF